MINLEELEWKWKCEWKSARDPVKQEELRHGARLGSNSNNQAVSYLRRGRSRSRACARINHSMDKYFLMNWR